MPDSSASIWNGCIVGRQFHEMLDAGSFGGVCGALVEDSEFGSGIDEKHREGAAQSRLHCRGIGEVAEEYIDLVTVTRSRFLCIANENSRPVAEFHQAIDHQRTNR